MSQKTGVAPTYLIQFTEAAKVNEGQSTSSPDCNPHVKHAKCKASVQFDTLIACFTCIIDTNNCSNSSHLGPVEIQPD